MIDSSVSGVAYNRFVNLDSIEDRVIYYLLSPNNKSPQELKQVHTIWRLLYYNDIDALSNPLPKYSDVVKLIYNDNGQQQDYRIFRSPKMEDAWVEECCLLKIYVDTIIPQNRLIALVNVAVEAISNSKILNVRVPDDDDEDLVVDNVDGMEVRVQTKSRVTLLTKAIISLLNGADVAGVGRCVFSREQSIYNQSQYGIWNNRNFEGIKTVIGVNMSGADI